MDTKKNLDLNAMAAAIAKQNDNAQPPKRFYLPYKADQIMQIIGANYRAEVLKRVTSDKYKQATDKLRENINRVSVWLCDPLKRPGLLLYGNVGTGKTTLLKAICATINRICTMEEDERGVKETVLDIPNAISIVKAKQIITEFTVRNEQNNRYNLMNKVALLAIDELGVENTEAKLYGNTSEPLIDLLCERYDKQLCTIISTNMGLEEIEERYGRRVSDRFSEMFTAIPFTEQSFRQ